MDAGHRVGNGSEPPNSTVGKRRERRKDENARPEPQEPREERERRRKRESMQEVADSQRAGIVPREKVVRGLVGHVKAERNISDEHSPTDMCSRSSLALPNV